MLNPQQAQTAAPRKHASDPGRMLLQEVGAALRGPRWVQPVAADLGVDPVFMHMLKEGKKHTPDTLWPDLVRLCEQSISMLPTMRTCLQTTPRKHAYLISIGLTTYNAKWPQPMGEALKAINPSLFANASPTRQAGEIEAAEGRKLTRIAKGVQAAPEGLWEAVDALLAARLLRLQVIAPRVSAMAQSCS